VLPGENERPAGGFDLDLVSDRQLVMQPARHQAARLALHRDLDSVAPKGGRSDRVGSSGRNASRGDAESQELSGQVLKRNLSALRRPEAECLNVVSQGLDFGELESAEPTDLAGGRIVPMVAGRSGAHERGLRLDHDRSTPRADTGKALAEREQQPR